MGYFSALDLELQIHAAEAGHASGLAHDTYLCGQCRRPRQALTVAPREWREVLGPQTSGYRYDGYDGSDESFDALQSAEAMRPRGGQLRYLGRAPRQP